ncbi:hypothetical protein [Enterococcus sp. LJL120]
MDLADFITVRLLDAVQTDQQLVERLLYLERTPLKKILVLPWQVNRAAQLLTGSGIAVGAVVDYPLAQGTDAKVSFEIADSFQKGADFVEVSLNPTGLLNPFNRVSEYLKELTDLAAGWGDILFQIDSQQYQVEEKITLMEFIREHHQYHFSLGKGLETEEANLDANIWNLSANAALHLQVNLENPTTGQIKMMLHNGVNHIGVNHFDKIDLQEAITFEEELD